MLTRLTRRLGRGARTERGAVAVIMAVTLVALLIAGALVLDLGVVRLDRQLDKEATDDAVMAGLRAADGGTDQVFNVRGVCGALAFLRANRPPLAGLPDSLASGGSCPNLTSSQTCLKPDGTTNDVVYHATTTSGSNSYEVWIKSPYSSDDASTGAPFPDESLTSVTPADPAMHGCDQIGVVVKESTMPGLGRLVTSTPFVSLIRSVGRVQVGAGDDSPALLLLERSACSVLVVGSGGSPSRIQVAGSSSPPHVATIHADSTATGADCGSGPNQQLFQGNQAGGIVAYGDGTKDGQISSVATNNGVAANIVSDGTANVYGTKGTYPTTVDNAAIQPRTLVTRRLVDKRYLAGVTAAVTGAYGQWLLSPATPTGYTRYACPSASDMTAMASLTGAAAVYIDCPGNSGITLNGSIGAGTVYFHGYIKGGVLSLPNATKVFIDDTDNSGAKVNNDALVLNNNDAFCVRATACSPGSPTTGQCSTSPTGVPSAKAQLFLRRGMLNGAGNSSLLRLCNTTAIVEGGQLGSGSAASPGGCLPTSVGTAPTTTPCVGASTSAGTGQINTSGYADWTAPNAYKDMIDPPPTGAGLTAAQEQTLWDGGEDLALWDETYGDSSGSTFTMAGGGEMHVAGVFMVPNAYPFHITGSGTQDLTNAQYIVRSFSVGGGAVLHMGVDPYNSVPDPKLTPFTLVR